LQSPPATSVTHQISASQDSRNDATGPSSPRITAMPELPPSPVPQSPKHGRETSKNFFSNLMASKSSHKLQSSETNISEAVEKSTANARSRASSKDRSLHSI